MTFAAAADGPMLAESHNHRVALQYARGGLRTFPCNPENKHPLPKGNWLANASINETQVNDWWTEWPDALIGLPHVGSYPCLTTALGGTLQRSRIGKPGYRDSEEVLPRSRSGGGGVVERNRERADQRA
jgi:hypothetical protein